MSHKLGILVWQGLAWRSQLVQEHSLASVEGSAKNKKTDGANNKHEEPSRTITAPERQTVNGAAGQLRQESQRRPNTPSSATPPLRNPNHGLRSEQAIERHRQQRTDKRRLARRLHRAQTPQRSQALPRPCGVDPRNPKPQHTLNLSRTVLHISSPVTLLLNELTKRETVERWVIRNNINISAIQETHIPTTGRTRVTHRFMARVRPMLL